MPGRGDPAGHRERPGKLELNTKYSAEWPNITVKGDAPADAEAMNGVENKLEQFFSPAPGSGD